MSDKSAWPGFSNLLGSLKGGKPSPKGLTTVEQLCAAGLHAVDPSWTHCAYCDALAKAGERSNRSVPPAPSAAFPAAPEPAAASGGRRATQLDGDGDAVAPTSAATFGPGASPSGNRGHTMVNVSPPGGPAPGRVPGSGRRLTGILTTFTWSRLGQLFEIHDGRNFVGSGLVASDNNSPCDVTIDDSLLSSAHFLVLCQGGKTIISDNFSTNGTFVDGEQIDTRGVELHDDAVIKAGATVLRFQKIHGTGKPLAQAAHERRPDALAEPEPEPDPGQDADRPPRRYDDDTLV